ncbi:MAG TPA: hypothetical protein VGP63_01435 [Planctomycetaceae bacterium]|jgi:hypothetical protein|nr:hypothetical protein [Planctomycetaceae bacterium]
MKVVIGTFLAILLTCPAPSRAGSGRQSDTIEVDYDSRVVGRWLERNADALQESTGAHVVKTVADVVTLRKETKHGVQIFRMRREGSNGLYRAAFVDRSAGELTDYTYEIRLSPLSDHRTEITVTMTAATEKAYGVSVNIELRKSIRGLRSFLQEHLRRDAP